MVTLNKPSAGDTDWTTEINDNWTAIENGLNGGGLNYVLNGGFEMWTTGITSYTSPADGTAITRGWIGNKTNSPTFTISQETTASNVKSGASSAKVDVTSGVASGVVKLTQTFPINPKEYQGKSFTFTCQIKTSTASKAKLQLTDSAGTTESSFHSGGGSFENLSVTRTIDSGATSVQVSIYVDATAAVTVYADEAMLVPGSSAGTWRTPAPLEAMLNNLIHVETKYVSSAITSFAFSNLDGDKDGTYVLIGRIVNGASVSSFVIRPNDLTHSSPTTVIYGVYHWAGIGGHSYGSANDILINEAGASMTFGFDGMMFAKSGYRRFWGARVFEVDTTNYYLIQSGGVITTNTGANTANITSLYIYATVSNMIAAGSEFRLYKVPTV